MNKVSIKNALKNKSRLGTQNKRLIISP